MKWNTSTKQFKYYCKSSSEALEYSVWWAGVWQAGRQAIEFILL